VQNFIVLGIIPGTDFQTTFTFWVCVATGFAALLMVAHYLPKQYTLQTYFAARKVARLIKNYDLVAPGTL
jgi:hypothetical protein